MKEGDLAVCRVVKEIMDDGYRGQIFNLVLQRINDPKYLILTRGEVEEAMRHVGRDNRHQVQHGLDYLFDRATYNLTFEDQPHGNC